MKRQIEPLIYWIGLIGLMYNMFVLDGYIKTYGLLYLDLLDKYGQGPEKTGITATVFGISAILTSIPGGLLVDRFRPWRMIIISALIGAVGAIIAAFAPALYVVYIGYGILLGFATPQLFGATVGALTKLFVYNRTIANGLAFAGGSLGMIAFPMLYQVCSEAYTFQGMYLILGALFLNFIAVGLFLRVIDHSPVSNETKNIKCDNMEMKPVLDISEIETVETPKVSDQKRASDGNKVGTSKLQELWNFWRPFFTLNFAAFILYYCMYAYGVFGYIFYIPPYLEELGLAKSQIATLLTINGVADLVSRIAVGFIGRIPRVNIYILIAVNMTIVGCFDLLVPLMLNSGPVYAVMAGNLAVVGLLAGGLSGLVGQYVADVVGIERAGTGSGFVAVAFGIVIMITPLVYGGLKETTDTYSSVMYQSGCALILGAFFIMISRLNSLRKSCVTRKIIITK